MRTMTPPAARANRPAAGFNRRVERTSFANRFGRSSQVLLSWWAAAIGSAALIAIAAPALAPWFVLPVVPALLLRAAGRDIDPRLGRRVMSVFGVAMLAAVVFQLAAAPPSAFVIAAAIAAAVLFLAAVERLALEREPATKPA